MDGRASSGILRAIAEGMRVSRRTVGILLLLGASVALGIAIGERFYHLFQTTVPPMALSGFSRSTAHGAFLTYGLVLGVVMCAWSLLAVLLSGFFRNTEPKPQQRADP